MARAGQRDDHQCAHGDSANMAKLHLDFSPVVIGRLRERPRGTPPGTCTYAYTDTRIRIGDALDDALAGVGS
ncbi:hypothetical protein DY245_31430 [Streptomyces inhibens]|uniref:Uncharacterized protein n=1 Tax=Streptomyces inhibens TaxID=2293571 RepID=A0A371PVW3_STRIH|nr:hypothetical protein DY245_31430 [Streptomyces inhibens]